MSLRENRFAARTLKNIEEIWHVFCLELKRIFRDPGVITIFFVAGLAYPILYKVLYWNDDFNNVPIAVVDMSASQHSRRFLHKLEATPEVKIAFVCNSMEEAEKLIEEQKVHGIIYFPSDYSYHIETTNGQAHISLYCDMTSFLYQKSIFLAANKVMLDEMHYIQLDRFERSGYGPQLSWVLTQGAPYQEVALYTPTGGYSSFIIPGVLVLILHQTLFLGIGMLAGTAREENKTLFFMPGRRRHRSVFRIIFGRSGAYFLCYYFLSTILLILLPRLMHLPHVGNPLDILIFITPFVLATIFFSMLVSLCVRNRESGMVTLITTSLLFLFISGLSWPGAAVPDAWRYCSYLIPSTLGINGFVHISSMGAKLSQVRFEYIGLWIQAGVYFVLAAVGLYVQGNVYEKRNPLRERHHHTLEPELAE